MACVQTTRGRAALPIHRCHARPQKRYHVLQILPERWCAARSTRLSFSCAMPGPNRSLRLWCLSKRLDGSQVWGEHPMKIRWHEEARTKLIMGQEPLNRGVVMLEATMTSNGHWRWGSIVEVHGMKDRKMIEVESWWLLVGEAGTGWITLPSAISSHFLPKKMKLESIEDREWKKPSREAE